MSETLTGLALLRAPFPPNQISKLPKPKSKDAPKGKCNECGGWHGLPAVHLDYVGHAALTARLLDADPAWSWEPAGVDSHGLPVLDQSGGLWIRLTVCGVTRLGYGDAGGKVGGDAMKERIGDALRNAAMRFGAALDLWHKGDLYAHEHDEDKPEPKPEAKPRVPGVAESFKSSGLRDENGVLAINALPPAEQDYLRELAMELAELRMSAGPEAMFTKLRGENLDNEQKLGLWSILDSTTRAAIKSAEQKLKVSA